MTFEHDRQDSTKAVIWSSTTLLLLLLGGCHRQTHVALPPALPPPLPTATIAIPPVTHVTPDAVLEEPPVPIPAPEVEPPKQHVAPHKAAPPVAAPPKPAPTTPAIESLGTLTTGGDVSQTARNEVQALLADLHQRVNEVNRTQASAHYDQMQRIRAFLKQADGAWKVGDIDGTRTLATKAKVLLDDIQH